MEDLWGAGVPAFRITTLWYVCSSDGVSVVAAASRCVCCEALAASWQKRLEHITHSGLDTSDIHIGDVKKAAHEGAVGSTHVTISPVRCHTFTLSQSTVMMSSGSLLIRLAVFSPPGIHLT